MAQTRLADQVYQIAVQCVSAPATLPPGGVFQQSDGSIYVLGSPDSGNNTIDDSVGVTQDPNSGNVTITRKNRDRRRNPRHNQYVLRRERSDGQHAPEAATASRSIQRKRTVSTYGGAASSTDGNTGSSVSGQTSNLPTISVVADSAAQPAVFYVESGWPPVTSSVTVTFTISSNGTLNTDYTLSGNGLTYNQTTRIYSVIIPAGQDATTVTLNPVPGSSPSSVTASLTLQPGTTYTVSSSSTSATATVTTNGALPVIGFQNSSQTWDLSQSDPNGAGTMTDLLLSGSGMVYSTWSGFVNYSFAGAGTAANGVDFGENNGSSPGDPTYYHVYSPLSGNLLASFTPSGSGYPPAQIDIFGVREGRIMTNKTFTITLVPGFGYTVDPNHASETVTIYEDSWRTDLAPAHIAVNTASRWRERTWYSP